MSELLLKFPGLKYRDIRVFNYEARFSAPAAINAYTYGSATTYLDYTAFNAVPGKMYFMDYVNISSNLNEADFTDAIDTSFNPVGFTFSIRKSLKKEPATLSPITFSTFRQNVPVNIYFGTKSGGNINNQIEPVFFQLRGRLTQTPAITLLGVDPVVILVQTTVYEISDRNWNGENFGV